MAQSASWLRPAYWSPKKRFFSPFQRLKWQCMPLPLSANSGFGMKVAARPFCRATFFTMYLYLMRSSAICSSESKRRSISHWPPEATSWCCASTLRPDSTMRTTISARTSWSWSVGGQGK